jgi:glycosyltransferase involved in cell wall biosynthesis
VTALVEELQLHDHVRFTGYVPSEDLPPLYSGAASFLMPSLYEGFGFPLLEAMACGAPAVASNASSLPEVGGDAALYCAPTDAEGLAAALRLVLTQPVLAQELGMRGQRRAAHFRWERCAAETAALYQEVAARMRLEAAASNRQ